MHGEPDRGEFFFLEPSWTFAVFILQCEYTKAKSVRSIQIIYYYLYDTTEVEADGLFTIKNTTIDIYLTILNTTINISKCR